MQNPPPVQQNSGNTPASSSPLGGMDPKVAGAISYIWIVGLIFFFIEKENKFVRFHALQSILFGLVNSVLMIVLMIVAFILTFVFSIGAATAEAAGGGGAAGALGGLLVLVVWLIFWLVAIVMFIGLVYAAIKAYQGQKFKLPIIGNIAENIVNK